MVGSGRYTLADYEPGQQTVMEKNDDYQGDAPAENDRVIIQYFDKASPLKLAVENGDVDIAYRSLSPTDFDDLEGADGVNVVSGNGTEIRYLVFNTKLQPGDSDAQKLAIRQAAAQVIDRQSIADNVYNGTVQPLYSMVPQGVEYANEAFADEYGEGPDVDAAKQTLEDAGVDTPVPLEVWWTPSHYGASSGDEYAEIKRQLDGSGLFDVTLKSTEWNQYSTAAFTDKYPTYQLGWFPDYPDADDYTVAVLPPGQLPEHPLRQPRDEQAAGRGEGLRRPGRADEGVRPDPEDRRRGRADDPDLAGRPGRRGPRRRQRRRGDVRPVVHLPVLADLEGPVGEPGPAGARSVI